MPATRTFSSSSVSSEVTKRGVAGAGFKVVILLAHILKIKNVFFTTATNGDEFVLRIYTLIAQHNPYIGSTTS